jgi:uncharacterized protein (DUF488 family)
MEFISMIKLFTIGFAGKPAEKFFSILINAEVEKIIDIRLNNASQLAGFTKGSDLKFFASKIGNIDYEHRLDYAPTKELLNSIRGNQLSWDQYKTEYLKLISSRDILRDINYSNFNNACFLCSESSADECHRKILADYLKKHNPEIEIVHL